MAVGKSGGGKRWLFALFLLFLVGYNLFRVALFALSQNGSIRPEHELSPFVNGAVVYSELAIGLLGLLAVPGLLLSKPWGFWLSLAVNGYAIAFDGWAAVAVQVSAAGGIIPPVLILLLLVVFRRRFVPAKSLRSAASVAQA